MMLMRRLFRACTEAEDELTGPGARSGSGVDARRAELIADVDTRVGSGRARSPGLPVGATGSLESLPRSASDPAELVSPRRVMASGNRRALR